MVTLLRHLIATGQQRDRRSLPSAEIASKIAERFWATKQSVPLYRHWPSRHCFHHRIQDQILLMNNSFVPEMYVLPKIFPEMPICWLLTHPAVKAMFDSLKKLLRKLRRISCFSAHRQSSEGDETAINIPNRQQETFVSAVNGRSAPRSESGNTTRERLGDTAPESVGWSSLTLSSLADISCRPYRNLPHPLLMTGSSFVL
jgi:hypothetical protein